MLEITAKHLQSSCQLFLVNNVSNTKPLVEFLGSGIGSLPTTYLRLPWGANLLPSPFGKESWKMQEEKYRTGKDKISLLGEVWFLLTML